MHSISQSWTSVSGALDIAADKATLALTLSTARSFIGCPTDMRGFEHTMQACAPPGTKNIASAFKLVLAGSSHWHDGMLTFTVRKGDARATFTCTETGHALECTYEDEYTLFAIGEHPQHVHFDRT